MDRGATEYIHSTDNHDGDAFGNSDEQIADTDPLNSNDWFRITSLSGPSAGPGQATVYFESSSSRLYTLLWSTNLVEGIWTPAAPARMGIGGADSMSGTHNIPQEFYQLALWFRFRRKPDH